MRQSKLASALATAMGGLLVVSMSSAFAMGNRPAEDPEGANNRIVPVAKVQLAAAATTGGKERTGEELYKAVCGACHETGVAGAPKIGDKTAWAPRIKLGLDGLLKSAIAGKNAMPPKGGSDANDNELAAAIVFLANKSGASFKEPKAGAAAASTAARSGEQVVKAACFKCHDGTEAAAPKIGDKTAWAPRVSKGVDKLVSAAIKGHGKMPARGGLADATDPEVRAAIEYMFNAAK
jgi:cytochrome c5